MREIKFRAWDSFFQSMQPNCESGVNDGMGSKVSIGFMNSSQLPIILMQYTGLKDKNGVEIYEGDILERTSYNNERRTVKWNNQGRWTPNKDNNLAFMIESEVIGNIHQNPEKL